MSVKTSERAKLVGALIRQARDDAGLNNTTLATRAGLPRRSIVRLANGQNSPSHAVLEKIADATGKSVDYFTPRQLDRVRVAAENLVEALVAELRETASRSRVEVGR